MTRGTDPRAFHRRLPGYAPTPLHDAPALAEPLGLGRVTVKDESSRLGLPAFKILGASWATYRLLTTRLGHEPAWRDLAELRAALAPLGALTLVTATDGNHGRAVARMASLLGYQARIFVPAGTVAARIDAIASEGATVTVVDGRYDDAVVAAAALATDDVLVVSDTSWPGYIDVPRWVIDGYATIFSEIDEQLGDLGAPPPDVVIVPMGVGALAAATVEHAPSGATIVAVEPVDAACGLASMVAGHPVEVAGPHRSIMVGLNCGNVSILAWPDHRPGRRRVRHRDGRRGRDGDARARRRRDRRRRDRGRRARRVADARRRRPCGRHGARPRRAPRAAPLHRGRDRPRELRARRGHGPSGR